MHTAASRVILDVSLDGDSLSLSLRTNPAANHRLDSRAIL